MLNRNQISVFIISFLIAGFFLLSTAEFGYSGLSPLGCCQISQVECQANITEEECRGDFFVPGGQCVDVIFCETVTPSAIPTLSQWGMIMMAGVLGLFAVIGIYAMRRRSPVTN